MNETNIPYEKTILVCTHNKNGEKPSCGDSEICETLFKTLRETARTKNLHPQYRVTQVKCLGQCDKGPNIMVLPENKWYSNISLDNIATISAELFKD